ncbi:MAG: hypothetical protein NZ585_06010 [Chloracidobacterium sp.]|nr:hypothetical protein [Chloracidobacterium sp.]MDW8216142.1 hypothetical protein [Acidobacteriota bacterium]
MPFVLYRLVAKEASDFIGGWRLRVGVLWAENYDFKRLIRFLRRLGLERARPTERRRRSGKQQDQ